MRSLIRQFDAKSWPISIGSVVVSGQQKNNRCRSLSALVNILPGTFFCDGCFGNRDGPLIHHMRDGLPKVTGPPCGTGPPEIFSCGFTPPRTLSHPMEWLAKKKTLKKL